MNITEIIKTSIVYPTTSWKRYLVYGIILVLANLSVFSGPLLPKGLQALGLIFSLIGLIFALVAAGFDIDIFKAGINKTNEIPTLDFVNQFVNGIKNVITAIVYYIIPIIILAISAFVMGIPQMGAEFFNGFTADVVANTANGTITPINPTTIQALPNADMFLTAVGLFAILVIILLIIFGILFTIAKCRLAKDNSLKSALNIPEAIKDLKKIGIAKFIGTYIAMVIVTAIFVLGTSVILGFVGTVLMGIAQPLAIHVVAFLTFLLVNPFIGLFGAQTLGLVYSEI